MLLIFQCLLGACLIVSPQVDDVNELIRKGRKLSEQDAIALEAKLKDNPQDGLAS